MRKINQFKSADSLTIVKVYFDSDWGEYRCRLFVQGVENTDSEYFTDDKNDAIDTAQAMVNW